MDINETELKTEYRTFRTSMPNALIPLYDFLQDALSNFLGNEKYRKQLENLDLSKHRGNVARDMHAIFRDVIQTWPMSNKAWYARMLYENIRRELESKRKRKIIWEEYVAHDKQVNSEFIDSLHKKHRLYPKMGEILGLVASDTEPELARTATFIMDFTVSTQQNCRTSPNNPYLFEFKAKGDSSDLTRDWIAYSVDIPDNIREENFTGRIAKPRFVKRRKDGKYIGLISYEVALPKKDEDVKRVLGVDIGKINPYSAIVVDRTTNKVVSQQLLPSYKVYRLNKIVNNLYEEKTRLREKIERVEKYGYETLKQQARQAYYNDIALKISNLKEDVVRNACFELIHLAQEYDCTQINIEYLSWLGSRGGLWNHSYFWHYLTDLGNLFGIKVKRVSCKNTSRTHPITGEIGDISGRNIKFKDGTYADRDLLASINLALKDKPSKKDKKDKKKKGVEKKKSKPLLQEKKLVIHQQKHTKISKSRRKEILAKKEKRTGQIVPAHPRQVRFSDETPWESLLSKARIIYSSCLKRNMPVNSECIRL